MKILVLESNPRELALISQALSGARNVLITVTSSEEAWPYIKSGEIRFFIANWDTSDLRKTDFIARLRAVNVQPPPYILLTTSKNIEDDESPQGMDDIIQRPFKALELKNRMAMAERINSLANNLSAARHQLETQAVFDELTGFMNRAAFLKQASAELERARRASQPLSMIALDVDNFKQINDSFGSKYGDDVLKFVSRAIHEKSRPYDCIGRWMGDEFVIALPAVIGADAEKVAERILAGVRGSRIEVGDEPPLSVKVSAGIASIVHVTAAIEVDHLIQHARQSMSRAQEAGGNQALLTFI